MDKASQESFRPIILERMEEIEKGLEKSSSEDTKAVSPDVAIGRLSRLDSMQMQQMSLAAQRRLREEMENLRMALGRIDAGRYGSCELCGKDISRERLEYQPAAVSCVPCLNRYA